MTRSSRIRLPVLLHDYGDQRAILIHCHTKKDNSPAIEECDQDDNDAFTNTNNTITHIQNPRPRTQKQTCNLKPVAPCRITRAMTRLNTRSRTHARQNPY